eukprot:8704954-Pyramimonas_sp.AAC.1
MSPCRLLACDRALRSCALIAASVLCAASNMWRALRASALGRTQQGSAGICVLRTFGALS